MLMGIDEFGPGTFGEKATEEFEVLSSEGAKNAYVSEKLAEQDKVVKEAEGLFSDYFITTYTGGAKSWDKSCIEMLVRFNEVICFPKNTPTCKKAFKDVALYL